MCVRRHEPFIDKWFGKDGERKLALADFMAFIVQLHHIFDELEFALLDADGSGSITGLDLARSLVAPASIQSIDQLLSRVRRPRWIKFRCFGCAAGVPRTHITCSCPSAALLFCCRRYSQRGFCEADRLRVHMNRQ